MNPLLVVLAGVEDPWSPALSAAGLSAVRVTGHEALEAVRQGSADCVLCERVPGWQALVRGVKDAGGAVVLLGEALGAGGLRGAPAGLVQAALPEALTTAVATAREPSHLHPAAPPSEEEAWVRFAEAVAQRPDLTSCAQEICGQVRALCGADLALLFLIDPLTGELKSEGPYPGAAQRLHLLIARKVATVARPAFIALEAGSFAASPILVGGDVIGVLGAVKLDGELPKLARDRLNLLTRPVASAIQQLFARAALVRAEADLRESHGDLERKVEERTVLITRAKREWERTFDAIREPIALQEGYTIRRANRAWAERAGIPIQEIPGQTCYRALAGRDSPCPGCPLRSGKPQASSEVGLKERAFSVNTFPRSAEEGDLHSVVHYRDVTEERRLQAKLRETERMASVGQLASGAAHEINNPLGFVISNLRTLRQELIALTQITDAAHRARRALPGSVEDAQEALAALPDIDPTDAREMVDESLEGAERVSAIVRGLRELSKLELDSGATCPPEASITRAVRAEFGSDAGRVKLYLRASHPAQVPPLQLDQALKNLLRNARQATALGESVSIATHDEGDQVVIVIADEGSGISAAHLPRIFEPFFTTRGIGQGLGLGLTTVYGIVQRHGGTIQVDSLPGTGATFTLRLPRATERYLPLGAPASAGVGSRTIAASTAS